MKLARWADGGGDRFALALGERWYDLPELLSGVDAPIPGQGSGSSQAWSSWLASSTGALVGELPAIEGAVAAGEASLPAQLDGGVVEAGLRAPLWGEITIYCASLNYHSHIRETGRPVPDQPLFFLKPVRCVVDPGGDVVTAAISAKPDYEVELAVVIGREAKHVTEQEALDHVAGYTVVNDVSFRDLQVDPGKPGVVDWVMGKALDTACPAGPWITTADEVPDPQDLSLRLWIGDDLRQDGSTSDMVFGVRRLVSELSRGITLRPGDVIATGTCSGVGSRTGRFLQPGDEVSLEVGNLGTLRHKVVAEEP